MSKRYKVIFTKKGDVRFISHLDLVRLFQRALRRADLPVTITQGFSPRLKVSITRAMKLGVESEGEEAIIALERVVDEMSFLERLNPVLPVGVRVLSVAGL